MKNADNPAMPVSLSIDTSGDLWSSADMVGGAGLTKREYFAGLAMGAIGNSEVQRKTKNNAILVSQGHQPANYNFSDTAIVAVNLADALLKELDR